MLKTLLIINRFRYNNVELGFNEMQRLFKQC